MLMFRCRGVCFVEDGPTAHEREIGVALVVGER